MSKASRFLGLALGLLIGCGDAQVSPHYRGEPLLKIQGTVTREDGSPLEGSVVPAIAWWKGGGAAIPPGADPSDPSFNLGRWVLHEVGVEGQFPAEFTLSVYEQPPPGGYIELAFQPGTRFAVGYIVAVPANHPRETPGNYVSSRDGFIDLPISEGVAQNYIVAYVPEDQPEGSILAGMLNGYRALAHGMHVVSIHEMTATEREEMFACWARADAKFVLHSNETYGTNFANIIEFIDATEGNEELSRLIDVQYGFRFAERCNMTFDVVAEAAEQASSTPIELMLGRVARLLPFP